MQYIDEIYNTTPMSKMQYITTKFYDDSKQESLLQTKIN